MFKIGKEVVKEVPYEVTIVRLKNLQSANLADGTELFLDWSREKKTDKKGTTPSIIVQKHEAVWNPPISVRLVSDFLRDTKSGKLKPKRLIFRLKKKPDTELGVLWINMADYYGLGLRENVTIPFQSPLGVFGLECHICVYHKENMCEGKPEPSSSKTVGQLTSSKFLRRSRSDLSAIVREQKTVNPLYLKSTKSANRLQDMPPSSPPKSVPNSPQKPIEYEQTTRSLEKASTYDDVMRGLMEADSDSGSNRVSRTSSFSSSSDDEAAEVQYMVNPKTGYGKIPIQVSALHRLSTSSTPEEHQYSSSFPSSPKLSPSVSRKTTMQSLPKKAYSHYGSVNGVRQLSDLTIQDDAEKEPELVVKRPPKGQYGKIPVEQLEE